MQVKIEAESAMQSITALQMKTLKPVMPLIMGLKAVLGSF